MRYARCILLPALAALSLAACSPATVLGETGPLAQLRRKPVAAQMSADGRWLYVANQKSGTLSTIDLHHRQVVAEAAIGSEPADLAWLAEPWMVLADRGSHQIRLLRTEGKQVQVVAAVRTSPYPVRVAFDPSSNRILVSCLWSRRLEVFQWDRKGQNLLPAGQLDLEFAPQELLILPDRRALVADAFGGRLWVVDPVNLEVIARRVIPSHNLHGLAVSPDGTMLAIAHMTLSEEAQTIEPDVHWGMLMSNDLRWLRLTEVLDPHGDLFRGSHIHGLGEANNAAADPGQVVFRPDGLVAVALGGVDQVAVGRERDFRLTRLPVGRRPVRLVFDRPRDLLYVVCALADVVDVIDLGSWRRSDRIPLGPRGEPTLAELGERLFYDGDLSMDGWMSCHSCHTDGHTVSLRSDNLGDGTYGAPKRILSLLGAGDTSPYLWNGQSPSLAGQAQKSVRTTMIGGDDLGEERARQLAAFLETLRPPAGVDVLRGDVEVEKVGRGRQVFAEQGCAQCHRPPQFTRSGTFNVGLVDELGAERFHPPSLRAVSQRDAHFHDGRAKTLDEVFHVYGHRIRPETPAADLDALIAYLRTL